MQVPNFAGYVDVLRWQLRSCAGLHGPCNAVILPASSMRRSMQPLAVSARQLSDMAFLGCRKEMKTNAASCLVQAVAARASMVTVVGSHSAKP